MRLGVNIDHIATLRQQRRGRIPDPLEAAAICERAGASSIVCHLREDRRHIQDEDVRRLKRAIHVPLNLEMSMAEEIVRAALSVRPSQVTLVPERRQELTTEGGLDVCRLIPRLRLLVARFQDVGISVSLFVDPDGAQVAASRSAGARIVELHTGRYAGARTIASRERELKALVRAAEQASSLGLAVAAGHGLDYDNIEPVVADLDLLHRQQALGIDLRHRLDHGFFRGEPAGEVQHHGAFATPRVRLFLCGEDPLHESASAAAHRLRKSGEFYHIDPAADGPPPQRVSGAMPERAHVVSARRRVLPSLQPPAQARQTPPG